MSPPQNPESWYPPASQPKRVRRTKVIVTIVVAFTVIVVIVVGALAANELFRAPDQPQPNVEITNKSGVYWETDCLGPNAESSYRLNATLINYGFLGYADIGYYLNGMQQKNETYIVWTHVPLPISETIHLHGCYTGRIPTYAIVLLSEHR